MGNRFRSPTLIDKPLGVKIMPFHKIGLELQGALEVLLGELYVAYPVGDEAEVGFQIRVVRRINRGSLKQSFGLRILAPPHLCEAIVHPRSSIGRTLLDHITP